MRATLETATTSLPPINRAASACTLLMNGRAGAFRSHAGPEQVKQLAESLGLSLEIVPTRSADHMRQTIRRLAAEGAERVAVAGGDGTIGLAVQELVHTETALGIVAQGTANNFATALRLPQDLPSALRVLCQGTIRRVDVGRVETANGRVRYFNESAGVGLFADALSLYGAGSNKNIPRALWAFTKLLFSIRARRVRLIVDGTPLTERAVMCEVANSFRMGYALAVAPEAKITDGLLDLVVFGDLERKEWIPYYRAIRAQTHLSLPKVETHQAKEIRIESRARMAVHADDRVIGTTPATITAQPRALKVLVDQL